MAALGLLIAPFLPSCGSNPDAAADPTTTSQSASASGEVRLGCGTYCQSAGGLAGVAGSGRDAVTINSHGTVTPDTDGYLAVTLTCNLSVQCKGALVAQGVTDDTYTLGRSDLLVDPGATATLGVHLPPRLIDYIRVRNPPCTPGVPDSECPAHFFVLADTGPTFGCARLGEEPRFPPCHGPVDGFNVLAVGTLNVISSR